MTICNCIERTQALACWSFNQGHISVYILSHVYIQLKYYVSGLPDEKGFLVRYKLWRQFKDICHGQWIHGICVFGVRDLYNITRSPRLFANKFRMEVDSVAYTCMEMWVHRRSMAGPNKNFNISFYANQPWVKNHV